MPTYNVHLYREMRQTYRGIEAESHEAAAAIARTQTPEMSVYEYSVEDCEGETFAALVDVQGDDNFSQSRTIDFENERLLKAAPDLVEALDYLLQQTIDQDLKHGVGLTEGEEDARKKALAAIAKAKGTKPLPPDPEGKNDDRAKWADRAIKAFQEATSTDDEDALSDLLGDLMHWADRNSYDFQSALDRAHWHYEAETSGEESA